MIIGVQLRRNHFLLLILIFGFEGNVSIDASPCQEGKMDEDCLPTTSSKTEEKPLVALEEINAPYLPLKQLQPTGFGRCGSLEFRDYDKSLAIELVNLISQEMKTCFITIAYENFFVHSFTLKTLLALPNSKQVKRNNKNDN